MRYSQFDTDALARRPAEAYPLPVPVTCHLFPSGLNDIDKLTDGDGNESFFRVSLAGVPTTKSEPGFMPAAVPSTRFPGIDQAAWKQTGLSL
ncbi:MAG: hypothetical protein ACI4V1_10800 [Eubacteriales bacterium]